MDGREGAAQHADDLALGSVADPEEVPDGLVELGLGGEPIFIAAPGEREGAVICQMFDAGREQCAFVIFNAFDVAAGPIATLRLDGPIHLGFHASFEPEPAR